MKYENFEKAQNLVTRINDLEKNLYDLSRKNLTVKIIEQFGADVLSIRINENIKDNPFQSKALDYIFSLKAYIRGVIKELKAELSEL